MRVFSNKNTLTRPEIKVVSLETSDSLNQYNHNKYHMLQLNPRKIIFQ